MNTDNKNLILAVTLSMLILVLYQLIFHAATPTAEQIAARTPPRMGRLMVHLFQVSILKSCKARKPLLISSMRHGL